MGLKLTLKPHERFVVNGVVIENGRHRQTLTVANHAQVMTGRSIMQPEEADTPAKRTYLAIQSMLLDPAASARHHAVYEPLMCQLMAAIREPGMAAHLAEAAAFVTAGDPYKALVTLRPVIAYESRLLGTAGRAQAGPAFQEPSHERA